MPQGEIDGEYISFRLSTSLIFLPHRHLTPFFIYSKYLLCLSFFFICRSCERFTSSSSLCCSQFIHIGEWVMSIGQKEKKYDSKTCLWVSYALKEWDEGEARDKDKWRWMSEIYIISCVNPHHVCPQIEGRRINTQTLGFSVYLSSLLFFHIKKETLGVLWRTNRLLKGEVLRETVEMQTLDTLKLHRITDIVKWLDK